MTTTSSRHGPIIIYCELLSNIRQVSVVATLSSPPDATTKAEISLDGRLFELHHGGTVKGLPLPARVSLSTALTIPSNQALTLTWRLPVSPSEAKPAHFSPETQALPWNSIDIKADSPIACRQCSQVIVEQGKITEWKDLPSENWAEMMEFWHCHKPHDHTTHANDHDETLANSKAYGANNAIRAQDGVGFVDLASFMFSEPDCSNLTVSRPSPCTPSLHFIFFVSCFVMGRKKVAMSAHLPTSDVETDTTPRE